MLDQFIILTKFGHVLFEKAWDNIRGSPLVHLINNILVEERNTSTQSTFDSYSLQWSVDNELDIIHVAVYQKVLNLNYVEDFLQKVKRLFNTKFKGSIKKIYGGDDAFADIDFEGEFLAILSSCERANDLSTSSNDIIKNSESRSLKDGKSSGSKKSRKWENQISKHDVEMLDFSADKDDDPISQSLFEKKVLDDIMLKGGYEIPEIEGAKVEEPKSTWARLMSSVLDKKKISESDLEPLLKKIKEDLVKKNVAHEVADNICSSVGKNLLGSSIGSFQSVKSVLLKSLEDAVKKILTPSTSTDILREIHVAKSKRRPYVITFIGVNGVGKSTNLSKVCFWLLQNKLSVLIAACDTFRSGAVEQLGVHVRNLSKLDSVSKLELFQRGYGKDAALIAKNAINYASENNFDVVLIDTAGRMQNNEPLMRSLSKLVSVNNPDKILFVGEALVGNEAIDQLTKFNQALKDYSEMGNIRQIDGIILTKFDTIDEKVGAALSMTYITGKPILFVGTGQTYTDLKRMNVLQIVQILSR